MDPRNRVLALFAGLGLAAVAVLAGALWLAARHVEVADPRLWTTLAVYLGAGAVILVVLVAAAWVVLDQRLMRPLAALVRQIQTIAHTRSDRALDRDALDGDIAPLADAVDALAGRLVAARRDTVQAMTTAAAQVEDERARLAAILQDVSEGVVVCNMSHQILLYNQAALQLLGISGEMGLGRPLFSVLTREPVLHALEQLTYRLEHGQQTERQDRTVTFVAATPEARAMLQTRMNLIVGADRRANGYVLTLSDVTEEIPTLARRDALLREATEGMRGPLANLRAAVETLSQYPDMDRDKRRDFDRVVIDEAQQISERVDSLARGYREIVTGQWPMADVHSPDLLNCLIRRLRDSAELNLTMTGLPVWLHADSYSLMTALDNLVRRIHEAHGVRDFDVEAEAHGRRAYIDILWPGPPVAAATLDQWLDSPCAGTVSGMTVRDVLERHHSEIWSRERRPGTAELRIALLAATPGPADKARAELPPRPEFYDFQLLARPAAIGARAAQPLRSLTYVVFDTETTGLNPSGGDEIISVAGVRIVNGRILTGETFDRLVDPGRPIPPTSTRFHGITDDMVRNKPPAAVVLPQFKAFVDDAVLIAHNAAFDMKFLRMKEAEAGVVFDNPVLDVLLLSVFLHENETDHTLDAAAERFGVEVSGRHTALGDALATAGIFVQMLDLLEFRGVSTLEDALRASNRIFEMRKRQASF